MIANIFYSFYYPWIDDIILEIYKDIGAIMRFDYTKNILFSFKINKIDIKFHISVLGMILLSATQLSSLFEAVISFIGYIFIIIIHELGHSFFVKLFKYKVYSIVLYFLGGVCEHEPSYKDKENFWIACGGVIFQLALTILAICSYKLIIFYNLSFNRYIIYFLYNKLIYTNLFIIIFNLLPIKGFDGYKIFNYIRSQQIFSQKRKGTKITNDKLADSLIEARYQLYKNKDKVSE